MSSDQLPKTTTVDLKRISELLNDRRSLDDEIDRCMSESDWEEDVQEIHGIRGLSPDKRFVDYSIICRPSPDELSQNIKLPHNSVVSLGNAIGSIRFIRENAQTEVNPEGYINAFGEHQEAKPGEGFVVPGNQSEHRSWNRYCFVLSLHYGYTQPPQSIEYVKNTRYGWGCSVGYRFDNFHRTQNLPAFVCTCFNDIDDHNNSGEFRQILRYRSYFSFGEMLRRIKDYRYGK